MSLNDLTNNFLSITIPFKEGGAFNEASLTSPALSPKIALKSFSSGVGSDSPFGVIFPLIYPQDLHLHQLLSFHFHPVL